MSEARGIRNNMLRLGFVTPNLAERAAKRRARNAARYAAARSTAVAVARGMNAASRGLQLGKSEFKSVDTQGTTATDANTSVTLLNGMTSGSGINQHVGREIMMKSVEFRYMTYATPVTGVDQYHRVILVYDRQTNGAAPAATDVLVSATAISPRNLENRHRFKILYDRTIEVNNVGEPGSTKARKFYRRLAHPVTFNAGVAGTVADITTGSLYMITIGTEAAGATAGSTSVYCRVRYQDA